MIQRTNEEKVRKKTLGKAEGNEMFVSRKKVACPAFLDTGQTFEFVKVTREKCAA